MGQFGQGQTIDAGADITAAKHDGFNCNGIGTVAVFRDSFRCWRARFVHETLKAFHVPGA
jgi:hypothetical protein